MGYYTSFYGEFVSDKPFDKETIDRITEIGYSWMVTSDKQGIEIPEDGKHYDWESDLKEVIGLVKEKGYVLNGEVSWNGEEPTDIGRIKITDNEIEIGEPVITYTYRKI